MPISEQNLRRSIVTSSDSSNDDRNIYSLHVKKGLRSGVSDLRGFGL